MAEGQELGPKASYVYLADNSSSYIILRDNDLSLPSFTGLLLYAEGMTGFDSLPRRVRPRGVHWMGFLNNRMIRKFIICGTPDSILFVARSSTQLTIGGIEGVTTGRRGETETFIRRSAAVAAP